MIERETDISPASSEPTKKSRGVVKRRYVDIHTHILPGVDDGSQEYNSSIQMLRDAYANGTGTLILTPHYKQRYSCGSAEQIRARFAEFRDYAAERVPVSLYLGTEAMYEMDLPQKLLNGEVLTMDDSLYVLIEFLPSVNYEYLCNGIFELTRYGYIPILAHVERYGCLKKNRVIELIHMGARIQVNSRSVLGQSGLKTKWFCHSLLRSGCVDFIASDAQDRVKRNAQLRQCAKCVEMRYGKGYADSILMNNAKKMLTINY